MKPTRLALLTCRDIQHAWESTYDFNHRRAPWGTRRVLHCGSCESERVEIVAVNGTVSARHYSYSDAYKTVSSLSKVDARAERLALLRKQVKPKRSRAA